MSVTKLGLELRQFDSKSGYLTPVLSCLLRPGTFPNVGVHALLLSAPAQAGIAGCGTLARLGSWLYAPPCHRPLRCSSRSPPLASEGVLRRGGSHPWARSHTLPDKDLKAHVRDAGCSAGRRALVAVGRDPEGVFQVVLLSLSPRASCPRKPSQTEDYACVRGCGSLVVPVP